ncbi:hypothetical protein [Micromonospora sp. LH3U1]|uniref:hypothetical protein n=1 Tax=Micromonospora sp. LH3U1 TaxID=3018339 RepID=UPI00234A2B1B|nr:hypothetical protein [Micromonospora sp. LH3U1]WCN83207.1 hypothetical protein PCA76_09225 [Micromonospora sp. LH3U1]
MQGEIVEPMLPLPKWMGRPFKQDLRPVNARCITGPTDQWVLLPDRDYWASKTV